ASRCFLWLHDPANRVTAWGANWHRRGVRSHMMNTHGRALCVEPDHWINRCECSPGSFASGLAAWNEEVLVGTSTDDLDLADERPRPAVCLFRRRANGGWQHMQTLFPVAMRGYEGVPAGFAEDLSLGSSFAIVGGVDAPNGDGATLDFE